MKYHDEPSSFKLQQLKRVWQWQGHSRSTPHPSSLFFFEVQRPMSISRWPTIQRLTTCHNYSTSTYSKAYSATLLLPKTEFPLRADPSIREEPFRQRTSEGLYQWQVRFFSGSILDRCLTQLSGTISKDLCLFCTMDHHMPMVAFTWVRVRTCQSVFFQANCCF